MTTNTKPNRETNGQYAVRDLDKVCGTPGCGHTLGEHAAKRSYGEQPCFEAGCACELFKAARR